MTLYDEDEVMYGRCVVRLGNQRLWNGRETAMATDDRLKQRLHEWGAWFNAEGGTAMGFPRKNILHPTWMPPAGGRLPEMMVAVSSSARERQVHQAVSMLSDKLIVAIVGKYARRMTSAQMALELCCTSAAIDGRIGRAHDQLQAELLGN